MFCLTMHMVFYFLLHTVILYKQPSAGEATLLSLPMDYVKKNDLGLMQQSASAADSKEELGKIYPYIDANKEFPHFNAMSKVDKYWCTPISYYVVFGFQQNYLRHVRYLTAKNSVAEKLIKDAAEIKETLGLTFYSTL